MRIFEKVILDLRPDLVVVVGDVNSTIACGLTIVKMGIPLAHVEAGLRSFDKTMPEEINRILTDAISEYLFTTERSANENLRREGVSDDKIFFVGNVMIDTLMKHKSKAEKSNIHEVIKLKKKSYALVTLHRPSNVDHKETLENILCALKEISGRMPIIFPCHPRTREKIEIFKLFNYFSINL